MNEKKITWNAILDDFKCKYPKLSKQIIFWKPYDYAKILIKTTDNIIWIYDYDDQRAYIYN